MKNLANAVSTTAVVVMLAFTSLFPVYCAAQDKNSSVPTRRELVTLLKTAKEPPEHLRIAAYYHQEAASLTRRAKEHAELAAIYQRQHPFAAMESKHGNTFGQGASHCEKFAELTRQQAQEAEALAELHENLAKMVGQKRP